MRTIARLFALLLLIAGPEISAEEATPIVSGVAVRAPSGSDPAEFEPMLSARVGEPLSMREVRRSIHRLYALGRFSSIVVQGRDDGPGRLQLTFVLEPKRSIASILFAGAKSVGQERLRHAIGLPDGSEYAEDRIDGALVSLRQAYARVGYERVKATALVHFEETSAIVVFKIEEGPPTRLERLYLEGNVGPARIARQTLRLRPFDVIDRDALEAQADELQRALRAAGYSRAEVAAPRVVAVGSGLAAVHVYVQAGPRMRLTFKGNRHFSDRQLRTILARDTQEKLDEPMIEDLTQRIDEAYRRAGYPDVRVFPRERLRTDGKVATLTFVVDEGLPLRIAAVRFRGNRRVASGILEQLIADGQLALQGQTPLLQPLRAGELRARALASSPGLGAAPAANDPLPIYDGEALRAAAEAIAVYYRDRGYLEVEVPPPALEIEETTRLVEVTFRLREGRQTKVTAIAFPGSESLAPHELVFAGTVRVGQPLSERRVERQRLALQELYGRRGHLYAQVSSEIARDPVDRTRATVSFPVREGPRVRVGRILIQGAERTRELVVRDALRFREGEVLGSDALSESQERLMRLGIFRTVAIRPIDPDVPEPVKDLVVELRERPTHEIESGVGLSIADGPRAFGGYTRRNLLGYNLEFGARLRVNYQVFREEVRVLPAQDGVERNVELGLRYPQLYGLPFEIGARLELIHERDIRPAYGITRNAALTGLEWPFARVLRGALLYELEFNQISRSARLEELYGDLSRTDLERLRFSEGTTLLGSLRPMLTLDLRDNPTNPHRGLWVRTQADLARDLGGDFTVNFLKLSGTVSGYIPVAARTTLALSVRGGKIVPLSSDSRTVPPKRFYLGGVGSLRGFSEDGLVPEDRRAALRREIQDCVSLVYRAGCTESARFLQDGHELPSEGGEVFALAKVELRFPIYGPLMGGIFSDAGNLWLDPRSVDLLQLRPTAGTGLRYAWSVGQVALDLGFNLDRDEALNESPFALHFSIGLF